MTPFVYHISPIDWGWENLPTLEEFAASLAKRGDFDELKDLLDTFEKGQAGAKEVAWEGDYRGSEKPRIFAVPCESRMEYGIIWKQDNNGSTFVCSPVEMPWLEGIRML